MSLRAKVAGYGGQVAAAAQQEAVSQGLKNPDVTVGEHEYDVDLLPDLPPRKIRADSPDEAYLKYRYYMGVAHTSRTPHIKLSVEQVRSAATTENPPAPIHHRRSEEKD
jgi:hypothetical protein